MRYNCLVSLLISIIIPANLSSGILDRDGGSCTVKTQFDDGSYYTGQIKDGMRHGHGIHVLADGSEYAGGYYAGKPHGTGTFWYPDGRRKWVLHDMGRLVESRFLAHDPNAEGCIFGEFISLGSYSGWFKGNKIKGYVPHGRGVMRYFNGSVFSGQWYNGKMHGNGTVRWEDGSLYAGQWEHGKRTGNGTYTWSNGDSYVGQWKENQMCGKGTYYYSTGKVKKGIWQEKKVSVNFN